MICLDQEPPLPTIVVQPSFGRPTYICVYRYGTRVQRCTASSFGCWQQPSVDHCVGFHAHAAAHTRPSILAYCAQYTRQVWAYLNANSAAQHHPPHVHLLIPLAQQHYAAPKTRAEPWYRPQHTSDTKSRMYAACRPWHQVGRVCCYARGGGGSTAHCGGQEEGSGTHPGWHDSKPSGLAAHGGVGAVVSVRVEKCFPKR